MSRDYFDFVLVKHENCDKPFLFRAPAWSHLGKNDEVIVETKHGNEKAIVIASKTLGCDEQDEIDFIMQATGASEDVKKVLAKIELRTFDYEEDDNE